jgi:outer membrane lipoprotein-sorting protein
MRRLVRYRFALVPLLALSLNGCLFRSRTVTVRQSTAHLLDATKEQLVARINTEAARIQTLNATVDIDVSTGGATKGKITDYREIRGYILYRAPAMLRMIGLMPIVRTRAFDMVSDGTEFKLWVPPKNKFVVGRNDVINPASSQPLENLRPQAIQDALLIRAIDEKADIPVLENGTEIVENPKTRKSAEQPDYQLDIISRGEQGWYLSRKIIFSRTDLQPHRQIIYDKHGYVVTDAHYEEFRQYGGTFPLQVQIWRPQEEYSITLHILKITFNQPLTDEQFALAQPPGAQLVRLGGAPANPPGDPKK